MLVPLYPIFTFVSCHVCLLNIVQNKFISSEELYPSVEGSLSRRQRAVTGSEDKISNSVVSVIMLALL